jgi:hypothetical protein
MFRLRSITVEGMSDRPTHMEKPSLEQIPSSYRKSRGLLFFFLLTSVAILSGSADSAWAFQSHPAPEGLYAHQLAHLFFAVSMGILAYWLHRNRLSNQTGWKLIQVSCALFVAWNVVTFTGHWMEELISADVIQGAQDWSQRIEMSSRPAAAFYVLKLDHLLCVPALLCLVLGLRSLYKQVLAEAERPHE